jgi:glycosyltransferase involved in cell wall biosynthesis
MNIAMIIPRLDSIGGGEKFFLECLVRWQKTNDVTVYTTSLNEDLIKEFGIKAPIEIINPLIKNRGLNLMTLPFEMGRLSEQIGKHDIYNPHLFPTNLIKNHPSVWCPQEPPRMLYDLKEYIFTRKDLPFYKRILFRSFSPFITNINSKNTQSDEIVANSLFSKKYLEDVYKKDVGHVVYPGVDWERYNIKKGNENVLLVVNRLFPEKRVDLAIKSLQYLDDHVLWIVGNGSHKMILQKLVSDLGLEDRVKFWGYVNEEKLRNIYSECFCTIFTPLREPFGMVALESMAAGKPVIGCNEGGFTEIMENNKHGFLVDPEPEKIAEKISYLKENKDIYKKMSKNCLKTAKIYSWEKTSSDLLNILKSFKIK